MAKEQGCPTQRRIPHTVLLCSIAANHQAKDSVIDKQDVSLAQLRAMLAKEQEAYVEGAAARECSCRGFTRLHRCTLQHGGTGCYVEEPHQ